jgi:multidrug resistance efflux pump
MDLTIGVQGQIDSVSVRPGDKVKKGQALARLGEQGKYEAAVASVHLDLLIARQELEDLRANAPKETADAQQALLKAKEDYDKAQKVLDSLKYPRASQERLDGSYNDYQLSLRNVALSQDRYDNMKNLPPDDPRLVDALKDLTNAQKEKDRLLGVYNWLSAKPTDKDKADAQANLDQTKAIYENAQRTWNRVKDGPDSMALETADIRTRMRFRMPR